MSKISVVLPLLLPDEFTIAMTRFCIDALRINATGKNEIELVIVETGSEYFRPAREERPGGDSRPPTVYRHFPKKRTYVKDWNAGADAATGEYLIHIGNDVIAGKDWDAALLEPFERYQDCGISCTSALEFKTPPIGHDQPLPGVIVEAMFSPFMCFRREWRFDEAYEGGYSDSDLIMRVYAKGLRAYRSFSSVCWHFGPMTTWTRAENDGGWGQVNRGEEVFYERWRDSPLMMYALIRGAQVKYGQEHFARCSPTPPEIKKLERQ